MERSVSFTCHLGCNCLENGAFRRIRRFDWTDDEKSSSNQIRPHPSLTFSNKLKKTAKLVKADKVRPRQVQGHLVSILPSPFSTVPQPVTSPQSPTFSCPYKSPRAEAELLDSATKSKFNIKSFSSIHNQHVRCYGITSRAGQGRQARRQHEEEWYTSAQSSPSVSHQTDHSPGKQWHDNKKAFRPNAGLTSYEKRAARDKEVAVIKAQEKELKEEKEADRQVRLKSLSCSSSRPSPRSHSLELYSLEVQEES